MFPSLSRTKLHKVTHSLKREPPCQAQQSCASLSRCSFLHDRHGHGPAPQPSTAALGTGTYCAARTVLVGVCESDAALRPPHLLIQIFTSVLVSALNFLLLLVFYINWFYGPRCFLVLRMEQIHRQVLFSFVMPCLHIIYLMVYEGLSQIWLFPHNLSQIVLCFLFFTSLYAVLNIQVNTKKTV